MAPDISPLAKRLAEENNVDWHALSGTGAGGRIVERDVLEFLHRVMSGDEDVNPTPEPVPEGMEAWPDEDVAAYFGAGESEAGAAAAPQLADDDLMTDDFASGDFGADDLDFGVELDTEDEDGFVSAPEAAEAPSEPDEALSGIDEDIFLFGDEEEDADASWAEADETSATFAFEAEKPQETLEAVQEPDVSEKEAETAPVDEEADATDLFASDTLPETEDASDEPPLFDSEPSVIEGRGDEASAGDVPASEAQARAEDDFGDAQAAPLPSADAPVQEGAAAAVTVEDGAPEVATLSAAAQPAPFASLPLASYGLLLRRHTDLRHLLEAQTGISHEFGGELQVPLASLLARAAAKALRQAPLSGARDVAVAHIGSEGVRVAPVTDVATRALREVLSDEPEAVEVDDLADTLALVVADLSDFDVDEAVLNLGVPVLTLGRILYDSEEGSHQSTLALSGEVSLEQGTRFLAAVADLLGSPVRLVV